MVQITPNSGEFTPLKKLLNEKQVAEMLRLSPRQISNLRQRRLLSFIKLGRSIRFDPERVTAELAKLTVEAAG